VFDAPDALTVAALEAESQWTADGITFIPPDQQPVWAAVGRPIGVLPVDWPGLPRSEQEEEEPYRWVAIASGLVGIPAVLSLVHMWLCRAGIISTPLLRDYLITNNVMLDKANRQANGYASALNLLQMKGVAAAIPSPQMPISTQQILLNRLMPMKLVPVATSLGIISPETALLTLQSIDTSHGVICSPDQSEIIQQWHDGPITITALNKISYGLWIMNHAATNMQSATKMFSGQWGSQYQTQTFNYAHWLITILQNKLAYLNG